MTVSLMIGANERISSVIDNSIRASTTGDGSQGTFTLTLYDPQTVPAIGDTITLTDGATTYYDGIIRSLSFRQVKTHVWISVGCQDDATPAGVPSAAPFGISDNPNYSTTYPFREMTLQTDSFGTSVKTTGIATIDQAGLTPGMNVLVTSANYGLSAAEMTVQRVDVTFPTKSAPLYTITFGDPIVTLARVVREIPDGAITRTMISDGAISTPKIEAYAVTTLSNDGGSVVIDGDGITIADGALNFPFPGGENLLLNSGFELGAYVAAQSEHSWTVATDWSTTRVRTATNITEGTELTLTGSAY